MVSVARMATAASDSRGHLFQDWARKAGRELLLAQASDWPFLIRMGTAESYARQRVEGHLNAFECLARAVLQGGELGGEPGPDQRLPGEGFPEPDLQCWTQ
jgi:predicted glycosyl hydrolase (DUF1957 family)